MTILDQLSSSQGKRSKEANKELAKIIEKNDDVDSINELVSLLSDKNKTIQSDSIEVLYELGYLRPELLEQHEKVFLELLESKNNRLVWGAMIALSSISSVNPQLVFKSLTKISKAINRGSVITKDAGVSLYANLAEVKQLKATVLPLLFEQLANCPDKQLAQYVEKSLIAIDNEAKDSFLSLVNKRLKRLTKESQIKRINKAIRQLTIA